jgi:hypothetical protein
MLSYKKVIDNRREDETQVKCAIKRGDTCEF